MSFNIWTFLLEVLNFVVLVYLLNRLLYRPLHTAIEDRRQAIAKEQDEAEAIRRQAEQLQEQLDGELKTIEQQRAVALEEAKVQGEEERRRIIAETDSEVRQRREEALRSLAVERQTVLDALQSEVVAQSVNLAERLLHDISDYGLHEQFAARLLDSLQHLTEDERRSLQMAWHGGEVAIVETAQPLNDETVKRLSAAMQSIVGADPHLTVESAPSLISGVRLHLDGHAWDSSLAGHLEEARHVSARVAADG